MYSIDFGTKRKLKRKNLLRKGQVTFNGNFGRA